MSIVPKEKKTLSLSLIRLCMCGVYTSIVDASCRSIELNITHFC